MQHFNSNGDDKTKFKSSNAESRFGVNLDKNGVQGNSDNTPEKGQPLSSPDLNSRFGIPETNSANYANNTERKGLSGAAIGIILLIIGAVMIGIVIFVVVFIGIIAVAVSGSTEESANKSETNQEIDAEDTENWQNYAILGTDNPRTLQIITKEKEEEAQEPTQEPTQDTEYINIYTPEGDLDYESLANEGLPIGYYLDPPTKEQINNVINIWTPGCTVEYGESFDGETITGTVKDKNGNVCGEIETEKSFWRNPYTRDYYDTVYVIEYSYWKDALYSLFMNKYSEDFGKHGIAFKDIYYFSGHMRLEVEVPSYLPEEEAKEMMDYLWMTQKDIIRDFHSMGYPHELLMNIEMVSDDGRYIPSVGLILEDDYDGTFDSDFYKDTLLKGYKWSQEEALK